MLAFLVGVREVGSFGKALGWVRVERRRSWNQQMSRNSGREAWERKWDEKVPGKVVSSFGFSLVAKR